MVCLGLPSRTQRMRVADPDDWHRQQVALPAATSVLEPCDGRHCGQTLPVWAAPDSACGNLLAPQALFSIQYLYYFYRKLDRQDGLEQHCGEYSGYRDVVLNHLNSSL